MTKANSPPSLVSWVALIRCQSPGPAAHSEGAETEGNVTKVRVVRNTAQLERLPDLSSRAPE